MIEHVGELDRGPADRHVRRGRLRPRHGARPDVVALEDRRLLSTWNVTNVADDGSVGTLRWAIAQANSDTSASVIDLQLGGAAATITLSQGQLELRNNSESVSMYDGPEQGPVTISGNNSSRVFHVAQGVVASFSGLTITAGFLSASDSGAGLYNEGTATLTDCIVSGNSTFDGNGAGVNNKGTLALVNCTVSENSTRASGSAGGLATYGMATLTGCTISGNSAWSGGGLGNWGVTTLTNCTVAGNSGGSGTGGGVYISTGTLSAIACTISGNSAQSLGGGLWNRAGVATLTDTIVAANTGSGGVSSDIAANDPSTITGTNNLVGTGGSAAFVNGTDGNIVLTSLVGLGLAPLADNGGSTATMALTIGSPAIHAGTFASGVTADQRGQPLDNTQPDIGAFQTHTPSALIVNSTLDDGSTGTLRWAVAQANAASGASGIKIALGTPPATITLSLGELELSGTAGAISVYDGAGQGPVTISGNNSSRVFQVDRGVTALLSRLTISGGLTDASGGGFYNQGNTSLTDCIIAGNSSTSSTAFTGGAGICNSYSSDLTLDHCDINGNTALEDGGGLLNFGAAALVDCTISGNTALAHGGGILNYYPGSIDLTGSTMSGNSASRGGGLYNDWKATLTNCTISGNSAQLGGGLGNYGAAALTACTISGNSASIGSGGVYNFGTATYHSSVSMIDTIVAGNASSTGNPDDIGGNQSGGVSGSFNLIGSGGSGAIVGARTVTSC